MSETDLESRLANAHADHERACEAVQEIGETDLERLADARSALADLFARYEDRATGTGDFTGFIEFQSELAEFVEALPDDLPYREAFEEIESIFDKRRLGEDDFERAREALEPVDEVIERLDDRAHAREDYREARRAVEERIEELDGRIAEHDDLLELADADLDAPVERLREPISAYNDAVTAAFEEFLDTASAREVCEFLNVAERYPLVETPTVPTDLADYVAASEAGTESIPDLLEYAEYSRSKLDHYVEDPDALKRAVATRRTALARIDATPFRIEWPPPPAAALRWRIRELIALVGRFAPKSTVARLREVRALIRDPDYGRLRRAARAREGLTDRQRERLASGAVADDREAAIAERDRLREALDRYAVETMSSS